MRPWFSYPLALHLLWLLPVSILLGWLARRRGHRMLERFGLLPALRVSASPQGVNVARALCGALGLAAAALAVAGPRWGRELEADLVPGRDLCVVLDLSRSMLARDLLPSRSEKAKEALLDLSQTIQRRGGHRLALVVFAARPRVVCPLTHDYDHFRTAVRGQDAARQHPDIRVTGTATPSGTRLGAALTLATRTHEPGRRGFQDILLLTDGDDPAGDAEWEEGVAAAKLLGIPVHVVGLGDAERASPVPGRGDELLQYEGHPVQSRLEEKPLQEIARLTRGTWIPARTQSLHLGELFQQRLEAAAAAAVGEQGLLVVRPRQAWFLGTAFGLLSLEMLLGRRAQRPRRQGSRRKPVANRRGLAAAALLILVLLAAAPVQDWETCLRQAAQAYEREAYEVALDWCTRAERLATDPGLVAFNKAAALHQLGLSEGDAVKRRERLREAERLYRACLENAPPTRRAAAQFNLGNTLLHQAALRDRKLLEQAIAAYEACLQTATEPILHRDARYNLELAKHLWLRLAASSSSQRAEDEPPEPGPPLEPGKQPQGIRPDPGKQPGGYDKFLPSKLSSGEGPQGKAVATQTAPAGKGNLPPLPDDDVRLPLTAKEAALHLRDALERIERERAAHENRVAVPPARNVKDW